MTRRELLCRLGADELSEWMAFFQLEPFGSEREDVRAAMLCSLFASAWSGRKHKRWQLYDFFPNLKVREAPDSESVRMRFRMFAAMAGQVVKKHGDSRTA